MPAHRADAKTRKIPTELWPMIQLYADAGWTQRVLAKQWGVGTAIISQGLKRLRGTCYSCPALAEKGKTRCRRCMSKDTQRQYTRARTGPGWARATAVNCNQSARTMNLPVGTARADYPKGCCRRRAALGANFNTDMNKATLWAWVEPLIRPMPEGSVFAGKDGVLCHDGEVRLAPWYKADSVVELDHIHDGPECLALGIDWNTVENLQFMTAEENNKKQHRHMAARKAIVEAEENEMQRLLYKDDQYDSAT